MWFVKVYDISHNAYTVANAPALQSRLGTGAGRSLRLRVIIIIPVMIVVIIPIFAVAAHLILVIMALSILWLCLASVKPDPKTSQQSSFELITITHF